MRLSSCSISAYAGMSFAKSAAVIADLGLNVEVFRSIMMVRHGYFPFGSHMS